MKKVLVIGATGDNWTIVRPATTFSTMRLQLVTLEFKNSVARALMGKKVVFPSQAKDKPATLSWGGDVAKMIARILFQRNAERECYNVCSAEHRTWGEIAEYYHDLAGLEAVRSAIFRRITFRRIRRSGSVWMSI